jgi:D-alanine-D-alanine ligase
MSAKRKTVVGVIFGGRSVEHDVSIVTGHQIMRAFDPEEYEVVPVYIDRDGKWFTGEPLMNIKNYTNELVSYKGVISVILSPTVQHHGLILNPLSGRLSKSEVKRLDVVFPAIHGSHGEDGTLQGLFELADIPYVGCGVLASAMCNDKIIAKTVLRQHDIPVLDEVWFTRAEWHDNPDGVIKRITDKFTYPVFVKPATLGSSIGVARVSDDMLLRASIDVATNFDRRILVEGAVTGGIEINCSVMGYGANMQASVLEQPVSWEDFLTYEEKYLRGSEGMKSAERVIPAPVSDDLTQRIKQYAIEGFRAVDGRGIARIDFLVKPDNNEIYLNEINTLPGSLSFYLWEPAGVSQRELVHKLVEFAREAYADKRRNTYNYQTNLVALTATRGLKGVKGSKLGQPTQIKQSK